VQKILEIFAKIKKLKYFNNKVIRYEHKRWTIRGRISGMGRTKGVSAWWVNTIDV
jgi:hypothetical protein